MTTTGTAPAQARERADTTIPFALVGPTASGKTEASVELARRLDAEIVLCDSMTIYRGMDVGTAKPSAEARAAVPHHLVDIVDPGQPFSVAEYQRMALDALEEIRRRRRSPMLVGGSGLYYRAVIDRLEFPGTDAALRGTLEAEAHGAGSARLHQRLAEIDPLAATKMEPSNSRRVVRALEVISLTGRLFSSFGDAWDRYPRGRVKAAGVRVAAGVLYARIEERARRQLEGGLLEETRRLLESGPSVTAAQAIGYAEAGQHLAGVIGLDEALEKIVRRTKALARRQMAWFKRDPRIRWFEAEAAGQVVDEIEEWFSK